VGNEKVRANPAGVDGLANLVRQAGCIVGEVEFRQRLFELSGEVQRSIAHFLVENAHRRVRRMCLRVGVSTSCVDMSALVYGITTAVNTGAYVDPSRSRMTVGTLAEQWIAGKVNLKPSTHALYGSILSTHALPRWRNSPRLRIEHGDIQAWVAELVASGLSPSHVRDVHGVLSGILGLAVRDRRLPSNPADGVDLPRLVKRKRRYLAADQVERLANVAGPDGRLVILILAYCGLRWCELAALRVGSVDFLRRRLLIAEAMIEVHGHLVWGTPKSHEKRSVPVPAILIDELAAHVAGKGRDDLVFTTSRGAPLRNRNARRSWFDAAAAAIGEPRLTPHELRHTAASLAVSSGANVKAVHGAGLLAGRSTSHQDWPTTDLITRISATLPQP
jgi:integrase